MSIGSNSSNNNENEKPIAPSEEESPTPEEKKAEDAASQESEAKPSETKASDEKENQSKNTRLKPQLLIEMGDVILDSLNGDFLGTPHLRTATYEYSTLTVHIYDSSGEIFEKLENESKAVVYVGFGDGELKKKLTGEKIRLGRIPPDATYLQIVDGGYKMAGSSGNSVMSSGEVPNDSKAATSDDSDRKVVDTKTGKAGRFAESKDGEKMANGKDFSSSELIASHQEIALGSECRVTNEAKKKSVVVTIADKGPFIPGLIMQLSKAAADQLELPKDDFAEIKIEVLGDKQSEKSQEQSQSEEKKETDAKDPEKSTATPSATNDNPTEGILGGLIDGFAETLKKQDEEGSKKPSITTLLAGGVPNIKFTPSDNWKISEAGSAQIGTTMMDKAMLDAIKQGNVVITKRDGTIAEIAAGKAPKSGVKIDYQKQRQAFIGNPLCYKRSPLDLKSAYGAIKVSGFSTSAGSVVSATVNTPGAAPPLKPGQKITVPQWGEVKMEDPIYPGSVYTWGDATMNGERVPESQEIMEGIVSIAQKFQDDIISKYENGKPTKWQVNSWYRDPAANARAGGSSQSYHMTGRAIDFWPPGGMDQAMQIINDFDSIWDGGFALGFPGAGYFIHVDTGERRRWEY